MRDSSYSISASSLRAGAPGSRPALAALGGILLERAAPRRRALRLREPSLELIDQAVEREAARRLAQHHVLGLQQLDQQILGVAEVRRRAHAGGCHPRLPCAL